MSGAHSRKIGALETIRKFCVACMGGSYVLVTQCDCLDCALHTYRQNRQVESGTAPPQHDEPGQIADAPQTNAEALPPPVPWKSLLPWQSVAPPKPGCDHNVRSGV